MSVKIVLQAFESLDRHSVEAVWVDKWEMKDTPEQRAYLNKMIDKHGRRLRVIRRTDEVIYEATGNPA